VLYEDAGDGYGYRTGDYRLTTYVAKKQGDVVHVDVAATAGQRTHPPRRIAVEVVTDDGVFRATGAESAMQVPLAPTG
jgi:alpha-glucosidase